MIVGRCRRYFVNEPKSAVPVRWTKSFLVRGIACEHAGLSATGTAAQPALLGRPVSMQIDELQKWTLNGVHTLPKTFTGL